MAVRIVCISDTHNYHKSVQLPSGDILIHAGDSTNRGSIEDIFAFGQWMAEQPFQYKIAISGNHDFGFQDSGRQAQVAFYGTSKDEEKHKNGVYYLQDSGMVCDVGGEKISVYGSPWQPWFHNWAFNAYPDKLKEIWAMIPKDIDILVTHGPAYKLLDQCDDGRHVGCHELRIALQSKKPKLHVFGHIHESHGSGRFGNTLLANASICTLRYNPTQGPLVYEYENGKMRQASQVQGTTSTSEPMHTVPYDVSSPHQTESEGQETSTSDDGQEEV